MNANPKPWALMSRHGHALMHLAMNPRTRLTDLARDMGMTEKSVRLLIGSLNRSEFLRVVKSGRNNSYELNYEMDLPHPFERRLSLRRFMELVMEKPDSPQ